MHNFVDIQTPTHDHLQRITHYCRRLSVSSREMQTSIASVNIATKERRLLSGAIRLVVLVREDLLATLAAGHAVLLLLAHLAGGELLLLL